MDDARAPLPMEPKECRQRAEDPERDTAERLVFATLAVAGELHLIRQQLQRKGGR
ncbi:hypothetical protein OG244_19435 [Streptomyces brevispora]|uniref:hypothetical protein n=1 Tax=Streptomyces brevispora TaxID=887462 RepID=UPI002E37674E|nr:hypothetical protein [Streptomyces brevispora]